MRTPSIRGAGLIAGLAALASLLAPAAASAHPLGNFSVNHLAQVSVSADRVDVRYVLDEAEMPTFQQRGTPDAALLARKRAEIAARARADRRRSPCRAAAAGPGDDRASGRAGRPAHDARRAAALGAGDDARPGRAARRDLPRSRRLEGDRRRARAAGPRCARASPAGDPTNGLRTYPEDLLKSPSDIREARLDAEPGAGTLTAPDGARTVAGAHATARSRAHEALRRRRRRRGRAAAAAARRVRLGRGACALAGPRQGDGRRLPGRHARAARGTPWRSGAIVTVTHTIGRLRARRDHARALAVRAARDALPVAEPGVGPARGARRRGGAARASAARAPSGAPHTRHATITTTTRMTTPRSHHHAPRPRRTAHSHLAAGAGRARPARRWARPPA